MNRVETIADLAESLGAEATELNLSAMGPRVGPGGLHVSGLRADRLEISELLARGHIHLERSSIRWLTVTSAKLAEGLLIDGCHIGTLELRSLQAKASVTLLQTRADSILLHDVTHLSLNEVTVLDDVVISSPGMGLSIVNTRAGRLRIYDDLLRPIEYVELRDLLVPGEVSVRGTRPARTQIVRMTAGDVAVQACGDLTFESCRVETLVLHALESARRVEIDARCAELDITADSHLDLRSTATVATDMHLRGASILVMDGGSVGGVTRVDDAGFARVRLSDAATITDIEPPALPVRSEQAAHEAAARIFDRVGPRELSLVRRSLEERPEEQDVVYFAQRQMEARSRSWVSRVMMGDVLGWGVRLGPPARALAVGLVITALVVHATGVIRDDDSIFSLVAAGRAGILALQLWTNVGVGLPAAVAGTGWAAASVMLTALGLVFTTLLLGIALRRLVR